MLPTLNRENVVLLASEYSPGHAICIEYPEPGVAREGAQVEERSLSPSTH